MNNDFFEKKEVTPNTFKIGMVSTLLFMLINVVSALTMNDKSESANNSGLPEVIRVVIYYFLYASIWYSMREVLIKALKLTHMFPITTWMLRLVIFSGLFTIALDTFESQNIMMLFFIVGLALLGVFINFMIRVMQLDYHAFPVIKYLRYFVISFIVLFFIFMVIELVQYRFNINLKLISNLLYALPFIFVYFFFKEVKDLTVNNDVLNSD